MAAGKDEAVLATASQEGQSCFLTVARPEVTFGRSGSCDLRIGHQPVADLGVPRVGGRLVMVTGDRLAVENLGDKLAFEVACEGAPAESVRPGALLSPAEPRFEVLVTGSRQRYVIRAARTPRPARVPPPHLSRSAEGPLTSVDPELTPRQWAVLAAYTAPLRAGRAVPATHAQVARAIGWSPALVRVECSEIWSAFALAGVPMRDFPDKRDAVVDAAVRHRLSPPA
ncbi:MAG: hypothetical protein ACRD0J_01785 [Acidimicrobiales bacterium]